MKSQKEVENLVFDEYKAKKFLKQYVEIAKDILLEPKDVRKILEKKGFDFPCKFPIVLKLSSDLIIHKTEEKAVKIVYDKLKFFKTLNEMEKKIFKFKARGILIEEFIDGQELIIGIKKDKTFGHVICLGLGGIFVENIKDISFRACPINSEDFFSMLEDLKFKDLILGIRGKKNDVESLKKITIDISKIPLNNPKILELDINPVIINENSCKIVDARIVMKKS